MLMIHGLSEDIQCHVWSHSLHACKLPDQKLDHMDRAVSLVIANGQFVWV